MNYFGVQSNVLVCGDTLWFGEVVTLVIGEIFCGDCDLVLWWMSGTRNIHSEVGDFLFQLHCNSFL